MTTTNETGRERLERLRVEVAEIERHAELARAQAESVALPVRGGHEIEHAAKARMAAASMVDGNAPLPVRAGDQIFAKVSGVTFATGRGFTSASHVTTRGETYTVTAALIEASFDAGGRSWLRHLVSNEAQLRRWNEVRFGLGPAPEGMVPEPGTAEHREAREQARQVAWSMPTPQARAEALAAVNERFGPAPTTSTTLSTTQDPSIAAAAAQRARLDASGPKFFMDVVAREAGSPR